MFGFSVYLNHKLSADDYNYLIAMRNAGFSQIFTSLILKEEAETISARLKELIKWAKDLDLQVTAFASAEALSKINLNIADVGQLQSVGLSGIRVTDDVSAQNIAKISKSLPVALNAGLINIDKLADLKEYNANFDNLIAAYDYYPRAHTGIQTAWFKDKNEWLHRQGLKIAAFIPGDVSETGEDGRPSLEKERGREVLASLIEMQRLACDHIYIGDGQIKNETIVSLTNYIKQKAITLHLDQDLPPLFASDWHSLSYLGQDVVGLSTTDDELFSTAPQTAQERKVGTLTMTNQKYGQLEGQFEIAKRALPSDERVNVLAHVSENDLPLLALIAPQQKIIFVKANNSN